MAVRWYAARTKPLAEYAARDNLQAAGLETFLPCAHTSDRRPGHQDAPLFLGYLFLHYDLEEQGRSLLHRVPHPVRLVAFGGVVPPVPDDLIAELAQRMEAINGIGGLWTRFQPGERVRVTLGPIESLAEVVEEARSPRARVRVLLEFLGGLVEAKVPWQDVQQLSDQGLSRNWNARPPRRTRGSGRWIQGHGPRAGEA